MNSWSSWILIIVSLSVSIDEENYVRSLYYTIRNRYKRYGYPGMHTQCGLRLWNYVTMRIYVNTPVLGVTPFVINGAVEYSEAGNCLLGTGKLGDFGKGIFWANIIYDPKRDSREIFGTPFSEKWCFCTPKRVTRVTRRFEKNTPFYAFFWTRMCTVS